MWDTGSGSSTELIAGMLRTIQGCGSKTVMIAAFAPVLQCGWAGWEPSVPGKDAMLSIGEGEESLLAYRHNKDCEARPGSIGVSTRRAVV